jgi:transcriptional regulator with XRE-family HTH domain
MSESPLWEKVEARRHLPAPDARRAIRVAAGVTQADVALEVGVDRAAVSRWERGERRPRGPALIRYSHLLQKLGEAAQ